MASLQDQEAQREESLFMREYQSEDPRIIFESIMENAFKEDGINHEAIEMFFRTYPQYVNPDPDEHDNLFAPLCCTGDIELVKLLLRVGFDFNLIRNNVLHLLCGCGETPARLKMLRHLIEMGANIDAEDSDQNVPLAIALYERNKEFATILMTEGADPKKLNFEHGDRVLDLFYSILEEMEPEIKEPDCV